MTRRMWSRRVLRAGWLIAPIFTFPGKVWTGIKNVFRNVFYPYGKFKMPNLGFPLFLACALTIFCFGVVNLAKESTKYSTNASTEELKEAAVDPCMAAEINEQLGHRAIKLYDIERMEARCRDKRAIEVQYKALNEQRQAIK